MESLIISYCFFTPKSLHKEMRFWDAYNTQERYWYNLPSLICINSIVYPNAKMKIHVSSDIINHDRFELIEKMSESFDNIEIVHLPYEYENTEPTMWRYKPLFDKESDIVLCRDIDSLPNSDEIRSTLYFFDNPDFYVQTLRTHTNHIIPQTIMLAGLCGFRPKKIDFINGVNFEMYYNHFKNSVWGLDQNSLINMFVRDPNWTKERFLDSPISTEYHKVGPPLIECTSIDQDYFRTSVNLELDENFIRILDEETKWGGEPTNFRGAKLKKFLKIKNSKIEVLNQVLENCSSGIKNFYFEYV